MEKIIVFEAALEGHVIGVNLPKLIHFRCENIFEEAHVCFVRSVGPIMLVSVLPISDNFVPQYRPIPILYRYSNKQ